MTRVGTPPPNGLYFSVLEELLVYQDAPILVCGYAAESVSAERQHLDGDRIVDVKDDRFDYSIQTKGGNSGSPVFFGTVVEDDEARVSRLTGTLDARITSHTQEWWDSVDANRKPRTTVSVWPLEPAGHYRRTNVASAAIAAPVAPSRSGADDSLRHKDPNYTEDLEDDPDEPGETQPPPVEPDNREIYRIIREVVIADSGDDLYPAVMRQQPFGWCFGLTLFPQASGHLGAVLKLMEARDPQQLRALLGPDTDQVLRVPRTSARVSLYLRPGEFEINQRLTQIARLRSQAATA